MCGEVEVAVSASAPDLPQLSAARALFGAFLPCSAEQLRRVYLRLALKYHPDKCKEEERRHATELFQAIAAVYEELLQPEERQEAQRRRVKSRAAAAAELGDLEALERLLQEDPGQALELDDLGVCPLMFAAAGGHLEAVRMLVSYGAEVTAKNPINWSVLLYACLGNHPEVVRWLVQQGAEITGHVLVLTAYTGNSLSLGALLQLLHQDGSGGLVAELRTESGKSLLHLACEGLCFLKRSAEEHLSCVEQLIGRVEVDQAGPKGRSCLQNLVDDVRWRTRNFEASASHLRALDLLCEAGASVVAEDFGGRSALSIAEDNKLDAVRQVLFSYI